MVSCFRWTISKQYDAHFIRPGLIQNQSQLLMKTPISVVQICKEKKIALYPNLKGLNTVSSSVLTISWSTKLGRAGRVPKSVPTHNPIPSNVSNQRTKTNWPWKLFKCFLIGRHHSHQTFSMGEYTTFSGRLLDHKANSTQRRRQGQSDQNYTSRIAYLFRLPNDHHL